MIDSLSGSGHVEQEGEYGHRYWGQAGTTRCGSPEVQLIKGKIEALDARLAALEKVQDAKFAEVNARLDALLSIHSIEIRLAKLEARSA